MSYNPDTGIKTVTPPRLMILLAEVPSDHAVMVNRVGNLSILDASGEPVGFIDFNHEVVTWFASNSQDNLP